jgi:hypothetical protein
LRTRRKCAVRPDMTIRAEAPSAFDKLGVTGSSPVPPMEKVRLSGPFFLERDFLFGRCLH